MLGRLIMKKMTKIKKSEVKQPEENYYDKYRSHNLIVKRLYHGKKTII